MLACVASPPSSVACEIGQLARTAIIVVALTALLLFLATVLPVSDRSATGLFSQQGP